MTKSLKGKKISEDALFRTEDISEVNPATEAYELDLQYDS
jgi:hypothetical protein